MEFVNDPPIYMKISKMKERVQWQHPLILQRGIDQTRLVLASNSPDELEFSFLVLGDSGYGEHQDHHPQRQIALKMLEHSPDCAFILHTGDVVYQVGSSEYYQKNFIKPYQEYLVGGDRPENIAYDQMLFKMPFLPVLGNHDYYDLPLLSSVVVQSTSALRLVLGLPVELNIGWQGSNQGDVYARAFIDYLEKLDPLQLTRHLERHYKADTDTGRCLLYQPKYFTRVPNRYYTFRMGGIDFFALDSNTFNAPSPLPATREGDVYRRELRKRLAELEQEELELLEISSRLREAQQLDDLQGKLEQIEEMKLDIQKQLEADETAVVDIEQLTWLKERLIASWHCSEVRGRVIYFHHPPYVTESNKWNQAQTMAVRHHLRWVLDQVEKQVLSISNGRPLVNVVFSGHAHCLEYLRTGETGHGDSNINWIICGGSGYSLRRQSSEGPKLYETVNNENRMVATSQFFVGRSGYQSQKRLPYSCVRVDVLGGDEAKFRIRPIIAERFQGQWRDRFMTPFVI